MSLAHVRNGYVLGIDSDLLPQYRLNPFATRHVAAHAALAPATAAIDSYFEQRLSGQQHCYTANGRQALNLALQLLDLQPTDCVTIFTSSENLYISGCVTRQIEQHCRWSRKMEPETKVIFVNHEFGLSYPNLPALKQHGLPIIEDCCYAFDSATAANQMGQVGDFVIYSFAKYFPVQFGGLLTAFARPLPASPLDETSLQYLKSVLSEYVERLPEIRDRRLHNQQWLAQALRRFALTPRFDFPAGEVPGVFMFAAPAELDLPELKNFLWNKGVHCSVFYGEQAFFIPVHQELSELDLGYFVACLDQFVNQ
ncbi:DegT/DnrJ/EryC1/StrS family aminotransferase [Hymenobacter sp. B81]|uniref:DegT/DnrJ/EryC1/StrS family aminotransferase n=1 Tax=Hymenobacter sp. B81 TaxID=3344878 RepID=UPI0037DC2FAE